MDLPLLAAETFPYLRFSSLCLVTIFLARLLGKCRSYAYASFALNGFLFEAPKLV